MRLHGSAVVVALALVAALLAAGFGLAPAHSQTAKFIIVQSTTSTENSGLFNHILPMFTRKTGIEVRVVAVGTGHAIKNASNGDGDVLFVHDKPSEEKFVAEGDGVKRFDVMYNDFVVAGPAKDPAKIAGSKDVVAAFKKIADAKALFVSRGDDSGTHKAELRLWKDAGVDAKATSGTWYKEAGSGMGATIKPMAAIFLEGERGRKWRAISISDATLRRRNYLYSLPPERLSTAAAVVRSELKETVRELVDSAAWAGVESVNPVRH